MRYRRLERAYFELQVIHRSHLDTQNAVFTVQKVVDDALHKNTKDFMDMAAHMQNKDLTFQKEMALPLHQALKDISEKFQSIEKERAHSHGDLRRYLQELSLSQNELKKETNRLSSVLKNPMGRGQWGEMQLRRVVEIAGMQEQCDFLVQNTLDNRMRPDMVIYLPGKRHIVIDAKTPLSSYLEALNEPDDIRSEELMKDHVKHLKNHIRSLSQKSYFDQFESHPEFVVLFLPSESMFSAALSVDPTLIESSVRDKVIVATPTTLITLLKSISYGWKQENMTKNAKIIVNLSKELMKRMSDFMSHCQKLGKSIESSQETYHQLMRTYESRVLSTMKKFDLLSMSDDCESNNKPVVDVIKI
jgi:DNA recombination protein RmuC